MIGITLSVDQIRTAPTDVRRWIEREVCRSLGLLPTGLNGDTSGTRLVACTAQDVGSILTAVRDILPAVNVFFEFGREGIPLEGVEAFRLVDIMHHARLQSVAEVIACLDMINQALRQVRNDQAAAFCGFDQDGHCFIATETRQNITQLWRSVVESRRASTDTRASSPAFAAGEAVAAMSPATATQPAPAQPAAVF
ncbi:MAG: hypothetical protein AB1586_07635 [Pseudomonadota bacterium]|jgi:hypothetical protein